MGCVVPPTFEPLEPRRFLSAKHPLIPLAVPHSGPVIRGLPGGTPRNALTMTILGNWIGSTQSATLGVRVTQPRDGEYFAQIDLSGPVTISTTARLNYRVANRHFTLYVVSPKLVVKMEGYLGSNRETPELQLTLAHYTRQGSFKSAFTLLPTL